ncbi:PaaI family thioesterase [Streptomyces sp. NPDC052051]|uniref:PaaI family thioesterase n=1 Tax=Streptomyces sp. NPDC052051 TaxID=3154649 RepID=UPI003439A20E
MPDTATLLKLMPFAASVGIRLTQATREQVVGTLDWAEERCTAGGILHGGALMALADSVGGVCAYLNLPSGAATSTIESKTNFFRGVRSGQVTATAHPLHVGGRTIVVHTEIRDTDEKLVALIIQTQAVLHSR